MESSQPNLGNNLSDYIASLAKGIIGIIPNEYGTSVISEIITTIIPNQRIDRVVKYCKELEDKLNIIPVERLRMLLENPFVIDLMEEGFIQASRAVTNDRIDYISSLVINGINAEESETIKAKHTLQLLQQLNDAEIIWLHYYFLKYSSKRSQYRDKHKHILTELYSFTTSTETEHTNYAIQKSYIQHLENLELIKHRIKFDKDSKTPIFNDQGKPKIESTEVTLLGGHLLKMIGLVDSIYPISEFKKSRQAE